MIILFGQNALKGDMRVNKWLYVLVIGVIRNNRIAEYNRPATDHSIYFLFF